MSVYVLKCVLSTVCSTCAGGDEAQSKGRRVDQLDRHIDVGHRGADHHWGFQVGETPLGQKGMQVLHWTAHHHHHNNTIHTHTWVKTGRQGLRLRDTSKSDTLLLVSDGNQKPLDSFFNVLCGKKGSIPLSMGCFPVNELFPWKQVQPMGELLVTVVDDAGVDCD